ncbi:MAG: cobalt-zinc-cadmium efflux system membrane fusion protein [Maribacter sp.]|jgi:cobalt-zinc-cadmium efflux system membrane fusion protein
MKRSISKLIYLSLIAVLSACGDKTQPSDSQNQELDEVLIQVTAIQFNTNNMQLGMLEEKQFPVTVTVNGILDVPPENIAVVSATMGGYIKTTPLLEGDVVKQGQALVTIENPEFVTLQQEYMEVHQQLTYLKAEYDRQQTMRDENITSQKSFLMAESAYKSAVARHTGLELQLQMLHISPTKVAEGSIRSIVTIFAPISGSITKVNVTKGSYVSPATSILEIIDNTHMHLELSVFEQDIMTVKKGQEIDFKIPEASEEIFKANVHLVGAVMEENRTIKVHGHLKDESENNFLTGMFVAADIITSAKFEKAIPSQAVVFIEEIPYVLVLEKKEGETFYFRSQEVSIKATGAEYVVIESENGFGMDTEFLVKGAFALLGV